LFGHLRAHASHADDFAAGRTTVDALIAQSNVAASVAPESAEWKEPAGIPSTAYTCPRCASTHCAYFYLRGARDVSKAESWFVSLFACQCGQGH